MMNTTYVSSVCYSFLFTYTQYYWDTVGTVLPFEPIRQLFEVFVIRFQRLSLCEATRGHEVKKPPKIG